MSSSGTMCALALVILVSVGGISSAALEGISAVNGGTQLWTQHSQPVKRNTNVQLCGYRLVEAVRLLCKGNVFTGFARRSDSSVIGTGAFNDDLQDFHDYVNSADMGSNLISGQNGQLESYWDKDADSTLSDLELLWPHSPKSLAMKVLTEGKGQQRVRRNISEECCKKSCSLIFMSQYCNVRNRRSLGL